MKKRSKYQQKIWWCRLIVSVVQVLLFLSHHTERRENMWREGDFHYDSGYGISDPVYSVDALHAAGSALSDPFYPFDPQ